MNPWLRPFPGNARRKRGRSRGRRGCRCSLCRADRQPLIKKPERKAELRQREGEDEL